MGHLRLTIGYLKATVVHIRVTLGHLKVSIGNFFSELHPKVRPTCSQTLLLKVSKLYKSYGAKHLSIYNADLFPFNEP